MNTYELCLKVIDNPRFTKEILRERYDMIYLMGSLTSEQYKDLISKISPSEIAIQEQ